MKCSLAFLGCLAALAMMATPAEAKKNGSDVDGVVIYLPFPQGYCELSKDVQMDSLAMQTIRNTSSPTIVLIRMAIPCGEIDSFRVTGKMSGYAAWSALAENGTIIHVPPNTTRDAFLTKMSKDLGELSDAEKSKFNAEEKSKAANMGIAMADANRRVSYKDDNAIYISSQVSASNKNVSMSVTSVTGTTMVNERAVSFSLYSQSQQDVAGDLLEGVKWVAAETVTKNALQSQTGASNSTTDSNKTAVGDPRRTAMYDTLDREIPTWRTVNYDAGFKAWLGQPDPQTGIKRQTLLTTAFNQGETEKVLYFFRQFVFSQSKQDKSSSAAPTDDGIYQKLDENFVAMRKSMPIQVSPLSKLTNAYRTGMVIHYTYEDSLDVSKWSDAGKRKLVSDVTNTICNGDNTRLLLDMGFAMAALHLDWGGNFIQDIYVDKKRCL